MLNELSIAAYPISGFEQYVVRVFGSRFRAVCYHFLMDARVLHSVVSQRQPHDDKSYICMFVSAFSCST